MRGSELPHGQPADGLDCRPAGFRKKLGCPVSWRRQCRSDQCRPVDRRPLGYSGRSGGYGQRLWGGFSVSFDGESALCLRVGTIFVGLCNAGRRRCYGRPHLAGMARFPRRAWRSDRRRHNWGCHARPDASDGASNCIGPTHHSQHQHRIRSHFPLVSRHRQSLFRCFVVICFVFLSPFCPGGPYRPQV